MEPGENMPKDEALFDAVLNGDIPGGLRIYNWKSPAVTMGYHQKGFEFFDPDLDIPLFYRPTGGGAVLHVDDITYALVSGARGVFASGIMESYHLIAKIFEFALVHCNVSAQIQGKKAGFSRVCFERSSRSELVVAGKKIMGAAQLRRRECLLQQGVLPLRTDHALEKRVFGSCSGLQTMGIMDLYPGFGMDRFIHYLIQGFRGLAGIELLPVEPPFSFGK